MKPTRLGKEGMRWGKSKLRGSEKSAPKEALGVASSKSRLELHSDGQPPGQWQSQPASTAYQTQGFPGSSFGAQNSGA